jgi:hypothetical protein
MSVCSRMSRDVAGLGQERGHWNAFGIPRTRIRPWTQMLLVTLLSCPQMLYGGTRNTLVPFLSLPRMRLGYMTEQRRLFHLHRLHGGLFLAL